MNQYRVYFSTIRLDQHKLHFGIIPWFQRLLPILVNRKFSLDSMIRFKDFWALFSDKSTLLSQLINRLDQCVLLLLNLSGISILWKYKKDFIRFLFQVKSRTKTPRVRNKFLSSSVFSDGAYIPFKWPLRKDLAIFLLSRWSVLLTFSLSVVGISAGLTTIESTPKAESRLWIQYPQSQLHRPCGKLH